VQTIFNGATCQIPLYRSESKIDEMLSMLWGKLIDSMTFSGEKTKKSKGNITAKIGSLAALLGIGELSGSLEYESLKKEAKERLSHLTYNNKIEILYNHLNSTDKQMYFNIYDGYCTPSLGKNLCNADKLQKIQLPIEYNGFGFMSGRFTPIRISPPYDSSTSFMREALDGKNNLWEFKSTHDSAFSGSFGCFTKFFSQSSQAAFIALSYGFKRGYHTLTCYGLIHVLNNTFSCDPIFFHIYGMPPIQP